MADKDKDPAFLFYPLDWLQGTASLFPYEKGIYIDLLCHQHQDGSLPNDPERLARMVGLSVDQFMTVWSTVRLKFVDRPGNRLVNLRLEKETTKRSTNSHKNAIIGRLAVLVRTTKAVPKEIKDKIKEEFNVTDYEPLSIEDATIRLTKWWTERLTIYLKNGTPFPIENENENNKEDDVGGVGEEEGEREGGSGTGPPTWKEGDWSHLPATATKLPVEMVEIFVKTFPGYPRQEAKDLAACLQIGYQIADMNGWSWQSALNGRYSDVIAKWSELVAYINENQWFRTKSLSFLNDKFQDLIQNKNNGTVRTKPPNGRAAGTIELINQLGADLAGGGSADIPR